MTLLSHHAHIFIGNLHNAKDAVFEYFTQEGVSLVSEPYYIQEHSLFSVEDAHKLKRLVSEKVAENKRIYLLIFVENFSHQSQHALLKTLEDQKENICICFVTPHAHTLLATLKSRVLVHYLKNSSIPSLIDVSGFWSADFSKRLHVVDSFLKKFDVDSARELRKESKNFLDAYEEVVYSRGSTQKNKHTFDAIFFAKEYIHDQGSSVKQLLEYVALS